MLDKRRGCEIARVATSCCAVAADDGSLEQHPRVRSAQLMQHVMSHKAEDDRGGEDDACKVGLSRSDCVREMKKKKDEPIPGKKADVTSYSDSNQKNGQRKIFFHTHNQDMTTYE